MPLDYGSITSLDAGEHIEQGGLGATRLADGLAPIHAQVDVFEGSEGARRGRRASVSAVAYPLFGITICLWLRRKAGESLFPLDPLVMGGQQTGEPIPIRGDEHEEAYRRHHGAPVANQHGGAASPAKE